MRRVPNESSASERARWLAELAQALEEAQRVAWLLGDEAGPEAMELYARIEAARLEVQSLQLGRLQASRDNPDPEWTHLLRWSADPQDRD